MLEFSGVDDNQPAFQAVKPGVLDSDVPEGDPSEPRVLAEAAAVPVLSPLPGGLDLPPSEGAVQPNPRPAVEHGQSHQQFLPSRGLPVDPEHHFGVRPPVQPLRRGPARLDQEHSELDKPHDEAVEEEAGVGGGLDGLD